MLTFEREKRIFRFCSNFSVYYNYKSHLWSSTSFCSIWFVFAFHFSGREGQERSKRVGTRTTSVLLFYKQSHVLAFSNECSTGSPMFRYTTYVTARFCFAFPIRIPFFFASLPPPRAIPPNNKTFFCSPALFCCCSACTQICASASPALPSRRWERASPEKTLVWAARSSALSYYENARGSSSKIGRDCSPRCRYYLTPCVI